MAKITIDNDGNRWPGSVTIADLAQFTPLFACPSDALDIYMVQEAMEEEWRFELEDTEAEYGCGCAFTYADGSRLIVAAWMERDETDAHRMYQAWKGAHS